MTDELFDYFGGNSARKVEPLDDSELFDDLKPALPASPSDDENQNVDLEDEEEVEFVEKRAETVDAEAVQGTSGQVTTTDDIQSSPAVDSHWDLLASSLGIKPPPQPARSPVPGSSARSRRKPKNKRTRPEKQTSTPSVPFGIGIYDDQPVQSPASSGRAESSIDPLSPEMEPQQTVEVFELEANSMSAENAVHENVLSEIFTGREEDFEREKIEIVDVDFDDDMVDDLADDRADSLPDFSGPAAHSASIEEGEDFVEFEVTDLEESPERGPRRRRRRPRGLKSEPAGREDRQDRNKSNSRNRTERTDRVKKSDTEPGERRGPPQRSHSTEDYVEPSIETGLEFDDEKLVTENRDQPAARSERTGRRRRRRGRKAVETSASSTASYDQDNIQIDDEELDGEDKKRKPNIPTWDDAIGNIIESNIQRHKSGSGNRGGRRRR